VRRAWLIDTGPIVSLLDRRNQRLAELEENSILLTCDSDFKIYRRNGRATIPVVTPENQ
jgi:hypothetical protein